MSESSTAAPFAGRNALVFAATGAIASATALELARQGARLLLSARDLARLQGVAQHIEQETGVVPELAQLDAQDAAAVPAYVHGLVQRGITPDWVLNGIGLNPQTMRYGQRSDSLGLERFLAPLQAVVGAQFLSASACAAPMAAAGRGCIVLLTSSLAKSSLPYMAGITAASDAVQGLARVLAAEYAPQGLRVVCVRVAGIPESPTIRLTSAAIAQTLGISVEQFQAPAPSAPAKAPLTLAGAARGILAASASSQPTHGQSLVDVE
jgi:3-oxoacyl-[acyl-carrier protein] reductase